MVITVNSTYPATYDSSDVYDDQGYGRVINFNEGDIVNSAFSFSDGEYTFSVNGQIISGSGGTLPIPDRINLGSDPSGRYLESSIISGMYYPRALSEDQHKELTR